MHDDDGDVHYFIYVILIYETFMFEDIPTTAPRRYGKLVSTISISARRYKKFNEIRREKKYLA